MITAAVEQNESAADFDRLTASSREPDWARRLRSRAFRRFVELGFPTLQHEEWRFTNLEPIATTHFALDAVSRTDHASRAAVSRAVLGPGENPVSRAVPGPGEDTGGQAASGTQ